MMKKKIFIDGQEGTTGLQIKQRLEAINEIDLISLDEKTRKDKAARVECLNAADLAVLCLPDEAARDIVASVQSNVKVLDSSTAHRTNENWVYGMAELGKNQSQKIAEAQFVSNPGCFAIGALALIKPLVDKQLIHKEYKISIHAVSGYSGGGKKMIADYENSAMPVVEAYALDGKHKHLPEIKKYSGLEQPPHFTPLVGNFRQGMLVMIPISHNRADDIKAIYERTYHGTDIHLMSAAPAVPTTMPNRMDAARFAGRDDMALYVSPQTDGCLLIAAFDNLGKGAAGNAVANIHLMLNLQQKQAA